LVFSSADSITKLPRKAKKTFAGVWQFQTVFWHVTCGKNGMARNLNTTKLVQARAQAAVTNRQSAQQTGAFYLMQLRSQTLKASPFRRRLQIAFEPGLRPEVPRVVKIIHAG